MRAGYSLSVSCASHCAVRPQSRCPPQFACSLANSAACGPSELGSAVLEYGVDLHTAEKLTAGHPVFPQALGRTQHPGWRGPRGDEESRGSRPLSPVRSGARSGTLPKPTRCDHRATVARAPARVSQILFRNPPARQAHAHAHQPVRQVHHRRAAGQNRLLPAAPAAHRIPGVRERGFGIGRWAR
eukprot:gene15809-biopygen2017